MASKQLPYIREVLPNGLVVMVYPMKGLEAVGLVLRVHSGHYFEKERGLAHATEHFLFLGTKGYPTERMVSTELESLGANNNATTGDRSIEVWMHLPKKNLAGGMHLMSELALHSTIPTETIEKERSVVIQEWNRRHDQPNFRFYRKLAEARFTDSNHPYIRDESLELLKTFKRDDVVSFYEQYFQPQQMVLGVGGGVGVEEAVALARQYFGMNKGGSVVAEPVFPSDSYAGKRVICHEEKFVQANLELSFPAFGWREKSRQERVAAHMGLRILGGSIVSRLWRLLREERGLVYRVGAGLDLMPWLGTTGIDLGCAVEKLPEVMKIVKVEVDEFRSTGPTGKEMLLEKEHRLGRLATGFEGSLGTTRYFVSEEFDQEGIILPSEQMEVVESITRAEIKLVMGSLFDWKRMQVGLMNDFRQIDKEEFTELAERIFTEHKRF